MIYGALTGTISTGLALLRVLDPHFETPAAADYMYSTGITFMLAIPLILSLNMPAHGYKEGDPSYYLYTILVLLAYAVFAAVSFALVARKEGFRRPGRLWKA
jgi:ESS family glutamate:Na+ symporter